MEASNNQPHNEEDLGFGKKLSSRRSRLINKDGSFNARRTGGGLGAIHPYQVLISMSWWQFWCSILLGYLVINALFALGYMAIGLDQLAGWELEGSRSIWKKFSYTFFFSTQTFTTVGYGSISPTGSGASWLASMEAMVGLLSFAVATGVLFGRFSKPSAKIACSPRMVVAPYRDGKALMFRIGNRRQNQLINLRVKLTMAYHDRPEDGDSQYFSQLPLERESVNLFPLSWTVVHDIDEKSPLYGWDAEAMEAHSAEFIVVVSGYDDTFAQEVHTRTSYRYEEVLWGARFIPAFYTDDNGIMVLEVDKIGICERAELPK